MKIIPLESFQEKRLLQWKKQVGAKRVSYDMQGGLMRFIATELDNFCIVAPKAIDGLNNQNIARPQAFK